MIFLNIQTNGSQLRLHMGIICNHSGHTPRPLSVMGLGYGLALGVMKLLQAS